MIQQFDGKSPLFTQVSFDDRGGHPGSPASFPVVAILLLALLSLNVRLPAAPQAPTGGQLLFVAGDLGAGGGIDGPIGVARFTAIAGVTVDGQGTVYVSDGHAVRKISTDGLVTTVAGRASEWGDADGVGDAARFNNPQGLATDAAGDVYVADRDNQEIRKITPSGTVSTLAGSASSPGATDGPGRQARFFRPSGVAVDNAGNVFVADTRNYTIRKISSAGVVSTLAGRAEEEGRVNGPAMVARFTSLQGIAVDGPGNVYVTDFDAHRIRKVSPAGLVTSFAGSTMGAADGPGAAAQFFYPSGLAIDRDGTLYVGDSHSQTIRRITASGVVTTLAGLADHAGAIDGPAATARFNSVHAVAVDREGNVYAADDAFIPRGSPARYVKPGPSATVRRITRTGLVSTLAGRATESDAGSDGLGPAARFESPSGVAADGAGTMYVADTTAGTVREITATGEVTTLAGKAGVLGYVDGPGAEARFEQPAGIALDRAGTLYVADPVTAVIRKITRDGSVTTLAGTAHAKGSIDGQGPAARFTAPSAVAVDDRGSLYVTDGWVHTIRKITPDGAVTTLAGKAGERGSTDGAADRARFVVPTGVAVDRAGNVYVCDFGNRTIREITVAGDVSTLAGRAGRQGSTDGTGQAAEFTGPLAIAVDDTGTLYVADGTVLRRITPRGVVTTIAGVADESGIKLGRLPGRLENTSGVALIDARTLVLTERYSVLKLVLGDR